MSSNNVNEFKTIYIVIIMNVKQCMQVLVIM